VPVCAEAVWALGGRQPCLAPLQVAELARSAEVLLLALPGGEGAQAVDASGAAALAVLRSMGLPSIVGVVQGAVCEGAAPAATCRLAAWPQHTHPPSPSPPLQRAAARKAAR
jgi:hypothetical protein